MGILDGRDGRSVGVSMKIVQAVDQECRTSGRKQILRNAIFGIAVATAALGLYVAPANAQAFAGSPVYPWCGFYNMSGGATNCYFSNRWQCEQAIRGNGGYCYRNPFYAGYRASQAGPIPRYRPY